MKTEEVASMLQVAASEHFHQERKIETLPTSGSSDWHLGKAHCFTIHTRELVRTPERTSRCMDLITGQHPQICSAVDME